MRYVCKCSYKLLYGSVISHTKIHFQIANLKLSVFVIKASWEKVSSLSSLSRMLTVYFWRCWSWNSNTLATWWEELTHLKRTWWWERLRAEGERDDRGWDGWMASSPQWAWVWVNSGSWWWTGRPGMLQFMGLQRVGHDWVNWTELNSLSKSFLKHGQTTQITNYIDKRAILKSKICVN